MKTVNRSNLISRNHGLFLPHKSKEKPSPLPRHGLDDQMYRRDSFLCNIYFPEKFNFLLFLDLDLLHTAPCPV